MASDEDAGRRHDRWAHLRFAVIGALLAAPPANPKRFMVLKPSITKRKARRINFDLLYSSSPTWHAYEALQRMNTLLLERLAPLGARDFIDVQSFIWVTQELE